MPDGPFVGENAKNLPDWRYWPETEIVLSAIKIAGGHAWFVGGCVRDALLDVKTSDIDICTDMIPTEVMSSLDSAKLKIFPTGLDHGTVTAVVNHRHFEITTLRNDIRSHGRHADVAFTDDLKEDASRRDFTINALYLDPENTLIDFFGGYADLEAGLVRFIGNADDRIREDRLRVLRFFRFFARYGKGPPDKEAVEACRRACGYLSGLSAERICKEILLLLDLPEPGLAVHLMAETGVLVDVLGEKAGLALFDALLALPLETDGLLRFAAIFNGDSDAVLSAASRLRMSNRQKERLAEMCARHVRAGMSTQERSATLYRIGRLAFMDQTKLLWARAGESLELDDYLAEAMDWVAPVFPVKGADLVSLGVPAGPVVGEMLEDLEEYWISADFKPSKKKLLERCRGDFS